MSAITPRALPHWAQVPHHRAVCSAHWSSRCWPTTALRSSAPTTSASLPDDTSVVGLLSNNDETHYREEVAQLAEWYGANNLSLNVGKTKEVVIDLRRNSVDHPRLTIDSSTVESVSSPKFLGVHITENLTWITNTMSLSKKAQQPLHFLHRQKRASLPSSHPSSPLSTGESLRVCWPAASLSGTGTVVQQTAKPSSGQWTQLQKSSVPLSPPSWIFSLHDAPAKPIVSWRTPPILPTVSSSSYHQEDRSGASEPAPPDCSTAFSPGCESPELNSPRPSLKPHTNPLPPETWTISPPPPQTPNLTTSLK